MADKVNFELVSPERLLVSDQYDMVVIPGGDGDFGVLPQHAPLISTIRPRVIDMHVDVPQPVPTHHDQGVTQPGQSLLKAGDRVIGGAEQVHDLVGRPAVPVQPVLGISQGVRLRGQARELREKSR